MTLLLVAGIVFLVIATALIRRRKGDLGWATMGMAFACMIVNLIMQVGGVA